MGGTTGKWDGYEYRIFQPTYGRDGYDHRNRRLPNVRDERGEPDRECANGGERVARLSGAGLTWDYYYGLTWKRGGSTNIRFRIIGD